LKEFLKKKLRPVFVRLAGYLDFIIAPGGLANCGKTFVHAAMFIQRIAPIHIEELHKKFHKDAPGIAESSKRTFVRILCNAKVFSEQGYVVNGTNDLCTEFDYPSDQEAFLLNNIFYRKPLAVPGISLLISGHGATSNYFHWMTDAVPKLSIAQLAGYKLKDFDKIIVSNDDLNFQKDSLSYLNIHRGNIISLTRQNYLTCEKLVAPGATCLSGNVSPWIVNYLRTVFSDWMEINPTLPSKIYVGRKKTSKRILLNEAELKTLLEAEGFKVIFPEDFSLKEQIQLFYNAGEIIGVHGAGLTNLIFSRQGTRVTELFPVTYVNQCYWTIASHNNLVYSYLLGEGNDNTDNVKHLVDSDFYISIDKLILLRQKV
jgi:hypothetical protein